MTTANPIFNPNANKPSIVKAETTIVSHLMSAVGKISLPVNGAIMTTAQLMALFQGHLDAITKVDSLRAQLTAAIQSEEKLRASAKGATICLRNYVAAAYGEASTQYGSLGFSPRKPAQKTAAEKAQAVTKLLATREARHTMGKVQKSKITGVVPGAPASPISAPATVVTAPSPAPVATAVTVASAPAAPTTPSTSATVPSNGASAAPSTVVAPGH